MWVEGVEGDWMGVGVTRQGRGRAGTGVLREGSSGQTRVESTAGSHGTVSQERGGGEEAHLNSPWGTSIDIC